MGCKKERLLKKNQNQNQINFNKKITKKSSVVLKTWNKLYIYGII
jgi:hypothetical protein